jgi:hypothetical protein
MFFLSDSFSGTVFPVYGKSQAAHSSCGPVPVTALVVTAHCKGWSTSDLQQPGTYFCLRRQSRSYRHWRNCLGHATGSGANTFGSGFRSYFRNGFLATMRSVPAAGRWTEAALYLVDLTIVRQVVGLKRSPCVRSPCHPLQSWPPRSTLSYRHAVMGRWKCFGLLLQWKNMLTLWLLLVSYLIHTQLNLC